MLSTVVDRFAATVEVTHADRFAVVGPDLDWPNIGDLRRHAATVGLDGGDRLVAAALVVADRIAPAGVERRRGRFVWSTAIPRSVGLGGSSAIVIATVRAALAWWEAPPPEVDVLARAALAAEVEVLGLSAGFADRAVQATGCTTLTGTEIAGSGITGSGISRPVTMPTPIDAALAWNVEAAAPSSDYHSRLRDRFAAGDPAVVDAMRRLAELARSAAEAAEGGDADAVAATADASLQIRRSLGGVPPAALAPVDALRADGFAVNFAGSGGAVVLFGDTDDALDAAARHGWQAAPLSIR